MKYNIEISKILDKYLPANGQGTERELLRMNIHRDVTDLINKLTITDVGKQSELVCELGAHEHNKSIFHLGQCHRCYKTKTIE